MKKYPIQTAALAAIVAAALALTACTTPDGFTVADTDKDGRVSPQENERYMLEAIYAQADADGNSKITFEEWRQANPNADKEKFGYADLNNDGAVTPSEAEAHFDKMGTMADLFDKMDADDSGFVTRAEADAFNDKLNAEAAAAATQNQ